MKNKIAIAVVLAASGVAALAEPMTARDSFLQRQAYDEMVRVSGQVDVLQSNIGELATRVARIENDNGAQTEIEALRAEIAALKVQNAELRNRMAAMHDEIIKDLTAKISKMQKDLTPPPPPPQPVKPAVGPHREYTVQSGDTLSLIAAAFKTTVPKIREMNNLKGDNIRVGQKLKLPL